MDVGDPSNFERILDIFDRNYDMIIKHMHGFSYTDNEIREIIGEVYTKTGYLCDPHGATACRAAQSYRKEHPGLSGIFLETAHPAKFRESVEEVTGETLELPQRLAAFSRREKQAVNMQAEYPEFRSYLLACK